MHSFAASVRVGLFICDRLATVFVPLRFNPQMAAFFFSSSLCRPLAPLLRFFIAPSIRVHCELATMKCEWKAKKKKKKNK